MANKREEARQARTLAAAERARAAATARAEAEKENDPDRNVVPWLRQLGFGLSEAREAAARCHHMPDASIAERIRAALRYFPLKTVPPGRAA